MPAFHSMPDPGGMCILQSSERRSGTGGCRSPRPKGPVTLQRPPLGRAPRRPTAQPSARSPRPSASFSPVRNWAVGEPAAAWGAALLSACLVSCFSLASSHTTALGLPYVLGHPPVPSLRSSSAFGAVLFSFPFGKASGSSHSSPSPILPAQWERCPPSSVSGSSFCFRSSFSAEGELFCCLCTSWGGCFLSPPPNVLATFLAAVHLHLEVYPVFIQVGVPLLCLFATSVVVS